MTRRFAARRPGRGMLPAGTILRAVTGLSALASASAVVGVFVFLAVFTLPPLVSGALPGLLSATWNPVRGAYGVLPMLAGSLCLSVSSFVLAYPLGLGACLFLCGLGPARARRWLRRLTFFMTGVPTVVYGFIAVVVLTPILRRAIGGSGYSWLAAMLVLAVLILPTIILVLDSQMSLIHERVRPGTLALGLDEADTLLYVVLPGSRRGLVAAAALGFGRAVGDTLIPLMLAGNAARMPEGLTTGLRTMTAHIALVVATDDSGEAYASLFLCGLLLFGISLGVNLILRLWREPDVEAGP